MNLFAALRVHCGETHAMTSQTRNSLDLIRFLDEIDETIAPVEGQQVIAIMDNLSTHTSKDVQTWLQAHPRWRLVFTPTHASWLNQIEIVFSIMHRRLLRHGHFDSPADLAEQMLASSRRTTRPPSRSTGPTPPRSSQHESTKSQEEPLAREQDTCVARKGGGAEAPKLGVNIGSGPRFEARVMPVGPQAPLRR